MPTYNKKSNKNGLLGTGSYFLTTTHMDTFTTNFGTGLYVLTYSYVMVRGVSQLSDDNLLYGFR